MKIGKTLYITDRKAWRSWLAKHHHNETEIWLIFYRKETGKPRISYNTAVEEALCYGWIDSIVKTLDKERFVQRFSARTSKSSLSQMNKERIYTLMAKKKMTKAGFIAIEHVFNPIKEKPGHFIIPSDILKSLKSDKKAWTNFQKFPETYKRVRIAYVENQKRHGNIEYQKALKHFIGMTVKGKRFGFVREMK